jgi:hypothetical protein
MKAMPKESKNDNEIAVRLLFFPSKKDATNTLKSIASGSAKFSDLFKERSVSGDKSVVDLGYVKKEGVPPELWDSVKKVASGVCCKDTLEIDGSQFGVEELRYAVAYVADRRPVRLPSLSNPQDKKQFQAMAEREKAIEIS